MFEEIHIYKGKKQYRAVIRHNSFNLFIADNEAQIIKEIRDNSTYCNHKIIVHNELGGISSIHD
jgi:hypothetical protein